MSKRRWLTAACLAAAGSVWSQDGKVGDAAKASEAMERAKRQAAGPMRVILEAGKPRRKTAAEGEGSPDEATVAAARAVLAARASGAGAAAVTSSAAVSSAALMAPAAVPSASPAPAAMPAAIPGAIPNTPVPESAPAPVEGVLPSDSQLAAPPAAVAALDGLPRATAVRGWPQIDAPRAALSIPAPAPAPAAASSAGLVKPRLLERFDPVIPDHVLDQIGPVSEVLVDLSLRADGSVAEVTLLPPAPRQLQRPLTAALVRWRFEPLPGPRVHRVQLVFSGL